MGRKTIRLCAAGLLMLLATPLARGQITLQVGAGGGVRLPMGDLAGETPDYYAGTKYGLSTGYDLLAKARVGLPGFVLVGGIEYGSMSNSGEAEPGHGNVEVSQTIFTVKVGPEFSIGVPAAPVTPYLGGNVAWHSISGETTFNGVARVPSGTFEMGTASRFGFGLNGGVQIDLTSHLILDIGAEYSWVNPLTKEFTVVDPTNPQRINSYKALNDDKDPLYAAGDDDHFIAGSRSMSTFSIVATIMFAL